MQRIQMILWGNMICRLTTSQETETIREENVNRYYDQFTFHRSAPETEIFKSKAILLLKDIQSPDSNTRREALNALAHAPFTNDETGILQEAVLVIYPSDSTRNKSTNRVLAERIIDLNDSSSVSFAGSHLSASSNPDVQNALLEIVSAHHTKSNYESLGKLLLSSSSKSEWPYAVTGKWNDSLRLAVGLFPTVLPLLKDSVKIESILNIASDLVDSNLISISIFKPWQETILDHAARRYKKIKTDTLNYSIADYSVINFLKRFNNDASNAMLKKWLQAEGNGYHKQAIVLALLENMQPVSQQALADLAASKYRRIDLYKNLKKYKKTALFPLKYRTQSYFAENLAQDAASEFSDDEADISFIQALEIKYKGKMARFFFYDVFINEEEEHWLAAAGPYNMDRTDLSLSDAKAEVYSEEKYDASNSGAQMKALITQMEKPADKSN